MFPGASPNAIHGTESRHSAKSDRSPNKLGNKRDYRSPHTPPLVPKQSDDMRHLVTHSSLSSSKFNSKDPVYDLKVNVIHLF